MQNPLKVYPVDSANGVYINLQDGTSLIDGMSSWWCAVHGYNHPRLNEAVKGQLSKMSHVMFGGLTHAPAVELGRRLVDILPEDLEHIFYCDSGSVSVEVALKMALQYMQSTGQHTRNKIATVEGGYHGDTWHAMSVCDPVGGMHSFYTGRLNAQFFAPRPEIPFTGEWSEECFEPMRQLLEENSHEIAAVILEPVVQGAGGMWFYHPEYLRQLRKECDRHQILLIADEIATGFGRTGKMFACQWAGITPDIMCLGKAITGGYLSFAAVVANKKVARGISANPPHVFMHGPTFMGNPLACAVACESLDLICEEDVPKRISGIETILKNELAPAKALDWVSDVRILGAIGVVQTTGRVDMEWFQKRCVEEGVWIRPFGKLVYIMPAYIISEDELKHLCRAMIRILNEPHWQ